MARKDVFKGTLEALINPPARPMSKSILQSAALGAVESGMARAKNAVNVLMKNYMDVCVCSLIFWALGYGLMFGANSTGWLLAEMGRQPWIVYGVMTTADASKYSGGSPWCGLVNSRW